MHFLCVFGTTVHTACSTSYLSACSKAKDMANKISVSCVNLKNSQTGNTAKFFQISTTDRARKDLSAVDPTLGDDILQGTWHRHRQKSEMLKSVGFTDIKQNKKDWTTFNPFFLENQQMVKECWKKLSQQQTVDSILVEESKFPGLPIFQACKFGHWSHM